MDLLSSSPVYDAAIVASLLRISYTPDELASFGRPPDPVDGFVTFFDPGWSIERLRTVMEGRRQFDRRFSHDFDLEPFVRAKELPRYRQVRLGPVPDSVGRPLVEQLVSLPPDEEVPTARIMVMATVLHGLFSGKYLPDDVGFWTANRLTVDEPEDYAVVIFTSRRGLCLFEYPSEEGDEDIGLASAKKHP